MQDPNGAEGRYQFLVHSIKSSAICMLNTDGFVVSWNSGAESLTGYSAEEIVGQHYSCFFTDSDRDRKLPTLALDAASNNGKFETEGYRVKKDGSTFWASTVIEALREESGNHLGFVEIARDTSGQLVVYRRHQETEARYQRLVEAVVDYAIFQLDPSGIIVSWNPGAERIKGYSADEVIGQHFSIFYTKPEREADIPARALEAAAREGRYEAEGNRCRKDGSTFVASVVIDPILEDGRLVGFAKVTRDITERAAVQKRLRETQEQLAAAQKMEAVGQLSGGIAHDFNNLLTIVMGNLETIQRRLRDGKWDISELQRYAANSMRGAQRGAALTSRLLAFSRRQALDPKPIEVNKFINGSADFLRHVLSEAIEIEAVGAAGVWTIEVDANHLEAALVNLAINARDAMPKGGKLTIDAGNVFIDEHYCARHPDAMPGQFVAISVSDTGVGMPSDVSARAFEPFFTTKDIGHGTGLGLSQVYGFVKQSGGHARIYSELGQGTTIKMYFPRFGGDPLQDAPPEPVAVPPEIADTVLLVEDDEALRGYVSELLADLSYRVLVAPDAQKAMKILEGDDHVDLLLTDVVMPGTNGRELAKQATTLRPALPVLFMTGYSRNAIVHHGRLDEGVDLLQKPFTQSELANRVSEIIGRHKR